MGITQQTFYKWRLRYQSFNEVVIESKEIADFAVEDSLFARCLGFYKIVKKQKKIKEIEYDPRTGKRMSETEKYIVVDEEVYYPPDVNAIIFWLRNRAYKKWNKDKLLENMGDSEFLKAVKELEQKVMGLDNE